MLAVIFVQKAVPQTDRQRQTHTHTQISKNRPPHVNFCFRRRTKLYGALRAPIRRILYIIGYHGYKHSLHNLQQAFQFIIQQKKNAGCVFFSWQKKNFDADRQTYMKKKSRPFSIKFRTHTSKRIQSTATLCL